MITDKEQSELNTWYANEYELVETTPQYYLLKKNGATGFGHLIIALTTAWWTLGLGNLIYQFASVKKKKVFRGL